jgi:hypothetical protein
LIAIKCKLSIEKTSSSAFFNHLGFLLAYVSSKSWNAFFTPLIEDLLHLGIVMIFPTKVILVWFKCVINFGSCPAPQNKEGGGGARLWRNEAFRAFQAHNILLRVLGRIVEEQHKIGQGKSFLMVVFSDSTSKENSVIICLKRRGVSAPIQFDS